MTTLIEVIYPDPSTMDPETGEEMVCLQTLSVEDGPIPRKGEMIMIRETASKTFGQDLLRVPVDLGRVILRVEEVMTTFEFDRDAQSSGMSKITLGCQFVRREEGSS